MTKSNLDTIDADRLLLLDRLAERLPELALDQRSVEWGRMPDGAAALIVDGGGMDGGRGCMFANAGEDVHAIGSVEPLVPGNLGCIVIGPGGSRRLAQVQPDPLAQEGSD